MSDMPNSSGIGFFGLLTLILIVLKLTNVIAWSWWWILIPIWGSASIIFIIIVCSMYYLAYFDYKKGRT